ncbi:MAG: 2-hydroxyacyl-CoA dehydratase family protein [Candidatus Desulfacyla sp.]
MNIPSIEYSILLVGFSALTRILKEKGFPTLSLEISGSLLEGALRTRVEAFIEMLSA